jgi:hypothetical protein
MLPDKRRTTVLVTLVFLLVIFLVPYFFVFIPVNADNVKRQAFLKLNRAAENIITKSTDTRNYYLTSQTDTVVVDSAILKTAACSTISREPISNPDSVYFIFQGQAGWNILYVLPPTGTPVAGKIKTHSQPLQTFLPACLSSGKEVFSAFMLVHYCERIGPDTSGKIIYQDFSDGLEQSINLDSLIPRHEGMRPPDISDISLEGTDYKLFTYPFQLGRHRLVLCGLMKTDSYNSQIHQIPIGTMYILIISLVLFLLSLPFLKIFMMNERDRLYRVNLVTGIVFLFAMAAFITIICTQLLLLQQERNQVSANLGSISGRIEDSLSSELKKAQDQLVYFDQRLSTLLTHPGDTSRLLRDSVPFLLTRDKNRPDPVLNRNRILYGQDRVQYGLLPMYHNFDHCAWISDQGQELYRMKYIPKEMALALRDTSHVLKDSSNIDTLSFVDVRTRQYYQEMAWHYKYLKEKDSTLMLAPVQSWASGQFRVNICRYSKNEGLVLQLMETRLYSMVNTVLPAGYGFALFNDSGNVLIHSDTLKSLRENFLDETGRLPWITGAVKGRQSLQSGSASFYGTNYTLRIQPLKQHPLFLAVFYNNDYLEPVNLRILSFSLFFCLVTFGLLILLFQVMTKRMVSSCLFSPVDYFRRMIPRAEKRNLYFNGSLLLALYMFCFTMALIFSPAIGFDFDYTVMVFGILTPFNICFSLYLLQRKSGQCKSWKTLPGFIWPAFVVGVFIFGLSYLTGSGLNPVSFAVMQVCLWIGFTAIVWQKKPGWAKNRRRIRMLAVKIFSWNDKSAEEKRLFSYSWFVSFFIFAIAVFPALDYCWFAYNHELRQSVKKEQWEIADGLQKRETNVRVFLRFNQPNFTGSDGNYSDIQYRQGVYPVYADEILTKYPGSEASPPNSDQDTHSESFYLSIAGTSNLFYKDPAGLPPLYDRSKYDNLWQWRLFKDSCEFYFSRPKWKIPPMLNENGHRGSNFKIISAIPMGFKTNGAISLILMLSMAGLLLAIYWITKSIARQVYLTPIVGNAGNGLDKRFGDDGAGIWEKCLSNNKPVTDVLAFLQDLTKEYATMDTALDPTLADHSARVALESEIIRKSAHEASLFECIWCKMDDKEKYLLYCLAHDGLLNHKNELTIYGLLNKKVLIIYDQRVRLVSYSFRNFILTRRYSKEENALLASMQSGASWAFMRTIVLVLIMSVFVFLFLTRQEVSAKIIALITSLSALLPFVLKFGSSVSSSSDIKAESKS